MVSPLSLSLALLAACFLAGQALTVRLATRRGNSGDVLLVVLGINIIILSPLALILDPDPVLSVRSIVTFTVAGITGTLLGRLAFYSGIKRVGASRAEPIKASMPFHATILAFFILGEEVAKTQFLGVVLIVIGIALVSWEGHTTNATPSDKLLTGISLPLLASFFFALEPIFASIGFEEGTSVLTGLTIKTITAGIFFGGYLAWRRAVPRLNDFLVKDTVWFVIAGVMSTGFLISYYTGLAVSQVGVIVPIMQTSPLLVILASAVFLRGIERVTLRLVVSAVIVVIGAVVVVVTG